jgi:hypothetical protein
MMLTKIRQKRKKKPAATTTMKTKKALIIWCCVVLTVLCVSSWSSRSSSSSSSVFFFVSGRLGLSPSSKSSKSSSTTTTAVVATKPNGTFHHPLECNKQIDDDPCLTTWQSKFGSTQLVYDDTVTIPCGMCIVLTSLSDSSKSLQFNGGLIVEGKLVILEGMTPPIKILTKYVVVYGTLVLESIKDIIDGQPSIIIEWIDDKEEESNNNDDVSGGDFGNTFRPPPSSSYDSNTICGGPFGRCDMGQKPFVVAGGRIDIRGLPSTSMPTFVSLIDVGDSSSGSFVGTTNDFSSSSSSWFDDEEKAQETTTNGNNNDDPYLNFVPPPIGCREDGILISHDFLTSTEEENVIVKELYFRPSYGSVYEWTHRNTMKFVNRTHTQHCPVVDLQRIRHCLQADTLYILTVRLRLEDQKKPNEKINSAIGGRESIQEEEQGGQDRRTECSRTGENCLSIFQARTNPRGIGHTTSLWKETSKFGTVLGVETTIDITFNFSQALLNENNIFEILQLRGPGPGIDMELLGFTLRSPPREAYPHRANPCSGNLIRNGDAELLGPSTFPFHTNNAEVRLSVASDRNDNSENENQYFALTGRVSAMAKSNRRKGKRWKRAGIAYTGIHGICVRRGYYGFQADVRMHSIDGRPAEAQWMIMGLFDDDSRDPVYETLAACPPSTGEWSSCSGSILTSKELQEADRYEIFLELISPDSDGVDYDVDNVSFEYEMSAGFDQLILPDIVKDGWGVGAEIIVASQQQRFDTPEQYLRKIIKMEEHEEEGKVRVYLDVPLDQPFAVDSSDNPDAATTTEVGLLSRNILFNATIGGHMSILHTPGVSQMIQGVELVGFGEEEKANSYPILFDSCQGGASIVSKNTIRQSDQGCVILEATSNVLVESNVGFDVKGPCFVARAGSQNNIFKNNIGVPVIRTPQLVGSNGQETNSQVPPIFLSDSQSNEWTGNVAVRNTGEALPVGNDGAVVETNEHGRASSPLTVFNLQEASVLDEM